VIEQAVEAEPVRRLNLRDAGLGVCIVLAVIFAVIVEYLVAVMFAHSAGWGEFAVLGVFAVPLVTGWVAIAISMAGRPLWVCSSVAALLLLVPPLILLGIWNA
jgi:hypothetical protein